MRKCWRASTRVALAGVHAATKVSPMQVAYDVKAISVAICPTALLAGITARLACSLFGDAAAPARVLVVMHSRRFGRARSRTLALWFDAVRDGLC
mgnify:CR=1 FL=1